jgi:hypothetical protein
LVKVLGESTRNLGYAGIFGMIATFSATLIVIKSSLRVIMRAKLRELNH